MLLLLPTAMLGGCWLEAEGTSTGQKPARSAVHQPEMASPAAAGGLIGAAYAGRLPPTWAEAHRALMAAGRPLRRELAARWAERIERMGAPLREGNHVHFFYHGAARQVALTSDITGWQPVPLSRLPGTDLWSTHLAIPAEAVIGYRLIVDGRGRPDPFNTRSSTAMGAAWSVYVGPEAPGVEPPGNGAVAGRWEAWEIPSAALSRQVPVRAFVPRNCQDSRPCQALIAADGPFYLGEGRLAAVTSQLATSGEIPPLVVVGIKPPSNPILRSIELLPGFLGDAWLRFVNEELLPELQRRLPVTSGPHGLIGLSAGGGAMLRVLLERPEGFAWAIIQSPAAVPPVLEEAIACASGAGSPVWLTWGVYETNIFGLNIRQHAATLSQLLRNRNFAVGGGERPAGHTMAAWRRELPEALRWVTAPANVMRNAGPGAPGAGSGPCSAGT